MGLFDSKKDKDQYDARLSLIMGRPAAGPAAPEERETGTEGPAPAGSAPAPAASPNWEIEDVQPLSPLAPTSAEREFSAPALSGEVAAAAAITPGLMPEHLGAMAPAPAAPATPVVAVALDALVAAAPPPTVPAATVPPQPAATAAQVMPEVPRVPVSMTMPAPSELAPPPPSSAILFFPAVPENLEETGLTAPFIQDHILRTVYFSQQLTGGQIAEECGLPFLGVIDSQLEALRKDQFVEILKQRGIGDAGYLYALTVKGTARALEALSKTQYRGPLPIPLERYIAGVKSQTIKHVVVTEDNIAEAFSDLVIHPEILDQVGPAVNSASAMFLFGYPGNGKTSIAERITRLMGDSIYIPFAVEVDGYVVKLMDYLVHEPVGKTAQGQDGRWVRIKRPTVVAGGELTMATLDLLWSEVGKFYEAPLQMKANGGMFLIDDFGRQPMRPQDLLNRWIVPLEKKVDYLTLVTGKKIQIPFDQLIAFSTNLDPKDLVDDAFLRRIKFKIDVKDPTKEHFTQIMQIMCKVRNVPFNEGGLAYMIDKWWLPYERPLRMCQPRDILDQMIAIAKYKQVVPDMSSADLIDRACSTYFVTDGGSAPKVAK